MSLVGLADPVVYLVTARAGDEHGAMIATWITPATLSREHPRILAVISTQIATHRLIEAGGRFTIQLLERSQVDLVPRFGLRARPDGAEWRDVAFRTTASGLRLAEGTCGFAECVTAGRMETGDRTVFLADVVDELVHPGREPLRTREALERQPPEAAAALRASQAFDVRRDDVLLARVAG